MSLPVYKQPIHELVRLQNHWAKVTSELLALKPKVPQALVDHLVQQLQPPTEPPPPTATEWAELPRDAEPPPKPEDTPRAAASPRPTRTPPKAP